MITMLPENLIQVQPRSPQKCICDCSLVAYEQKFWETRWQYVAAIRCQPGFYFTALKEISKAGNFLEEPFRGQ